MRRAWDLVLLPFALGWMVLLLALVMLRVVQPDSLARNIRQAHWPPADPSAGGEVDPVPGAVPAGIPARLN
jgi:hypothetical protein